MYTLIFFLLLVAVITPIFGRALGSEISINISIFSLISCFLVSVFVFFEVVYRGFVCEVLIFNWIDFFSVYAPFVLLFDKLSVTMLVLVIFISTLVHIYAWNYMSGDPSILRFFFFLSLFTFFMCLMVISGSLVQFFLA